MSTPPTPPPKELLLNLEGYASTVGLWEILGDYQSLVRWSQKKVKGLASLGSAGMPCWTRSSPTSDVFPRIPDGEWVVGRLCFSLSPTCTSIESAPMELPHLPNWVWHCSACAMQTRYQPIHPATCDQSACSLVGYSSHRPQPAWPSPGLMGIVFLCHQAHPSVRNTGLAVPQ